jgi:hypothetical protein
VLNSKPGRSRIHGLKPDSQLEGGGTSKRLRCVHMTRRATPPHNKQLQRTVTPNRWRAASASFHYAHAARWTRGHAAAQLRR